MTFYKLGPPGLHPIFLPEDIRKKSRTAVRAWLQRNQGDQIAEMGLKILTELAHDSGIRIVRNDHGSGLWRDTPLARPYILIEATSENLEKVRQILPPGWTITEKEMPQLKAIKSPRPQA